MDKISIKKWQSNRLIFLGLLLFLLGLLIALFIPVMGNPRMGLSAHLEGTLNGMFLIILGLIWNNLILSEKWFSAAFWSAVYGSFANYLAVSIAAISGQGKMMPLAGGKDGNEAIETLISFLLVSLSLAMVFLCVTVLIGYYRCMQQTENNK